MLEIVIVGAVATASVDVWQQILKRVFKIPIVNWGLVGRWVSGWPRGVFAHASMAKVPEAPAEHAVGWVFHYAVGVTYAAIYLAVVRALGETGPGFASAMLFGAATLVSPFFLMHPAMGLGVLAQRAASPATVRLMTVTSHLAFGLGLYLGRLAGDALAAT